MIDEVAHDLQLMGKIQPVQTEIIPLVEAMPNTVYEGRTDPVPFPPFRPAVRRNPLWVSTLTVLFLLGGAAVLYPLPAKDRLVDFSSAIKGLLDNAEDRFGVVLPDPDQRSVAAPAETKEQGDRFPANSPQALKKGSLQQTQKSALLNGPQATSLPPPNNQDAAKSVEPLDSSLPIKLKKEAVADDLDRPLGGSGFSPSADVRKGRPFVVRYGSTISRIAIDVYGPNLFLAIDLLKEFNTHIENFNWVLAGQKLWLPPLNQETLIRKQEDGSYRFIIGSFLSSRSAERLANNARRKGYVASVTPRRISNDTQLYRVEIGGLKDSEVAQKAWEVARTRRWLVVGEGKEQQKRLSRGY
jgi:hypothetical protein